MSGSMIESVRVGTVKAQLPHPLIDLAGWHAAARAEDKSIAELLGGRLEPMPATANISYPQGRVGPAEVEAQVTELAAAGCVRFKAAVAATLDVPVEWGVRWTGVDPYADSLVAPVIRSDGHKEWLLYVPGFGDLVNHEWLATQRVDDPDRIVS